MPEGIVFVHIEDARNADGASRRRFRQGLVIEYPLQFIGVKIGQAIFLAPYNARSPFTAIARNVAAAVAETVDGQGAVIGALAAAGVFCRVSKGIDGALI